MHLSIHAAELLLELLEQPAPRLSAEGARMVAEPATELRHRGSLIPDGYEALLSGLDSDDGDAAAVQTDHSRGLHVFQEASGLTEVDINQLARFVVHIDRFLQELTASLHRPHGSRQRDLLPGIAWELGGFRLPGRATTTPIWFARRLHDRDIATLIAEQARSRNQRQLIVLTSTKAARVALAGWPSGTVVSLHDLLTLDGGLAIEPATLVRLLDGLPDEDDASLPVLMAEGREVRFLGETYRFPRGDKQRRVVCFLHERAVAGQRAVSAAEVMAALDLEPDVKFRSLFKGNRAWGRLLRQRDGMLEFCWPGRPAP